MIGYVPVIAFAGPIVSWPACRFAAGSFCGSFLFLWYLPFFPSVCRFCFTLAVFSFAASISELLPVRVARIRDARSVRAVVIKHRGKGCLLLDNWLRYPLGEEVAFQLVF